MRRGSLIALVLFVIGALIVVIQLSDTGPIGPKGDVVCHSTAPEHKAGQRQRGRTDSEPDCTYTALGAPVVSVATPPAAAAPPSLRNQMPREFSSRVQEAPLLQMPAYVDSNSPVFWSGDNMTVLNSAFAETYVAVGPNITDLPDVRFVQLPQPQREGVVWMESVWRDPDTSVLYGWYHFEPSDLPCLTAPIIGAAISRDGGEIWEDKGFVLENGHDIDCDYENGYFTGGNGDFTVLPSPDKKYFYFVFTNYGGPVEEQGVAVARSSYEDHGQPGTVFKYYDGKWEQPGLGGKVAPVLPTEVSWKEAGVDSFWGPSVHWNTYLRSYVALLNRAAGDGWTQEGIYIAYSRDLVRWTLPQKIADSPDWYPQVIGLDRGDSDTQAGQLVRLFVGGQSIALLEFDRTPGQAQPPAETPLLRVPFPVTGPEPSIGSSGRTESSPQEQASSTDTVPQLVPQFLQPQYQPSYIQPELNGVPVPVEPPPIDAQPAPVTGPRSQTSNSQPVTATPASVPGRNIDIDPTDTFNPNARGN